MRQRSSYSDMLEEHGLWETFRSDYLEKLEGRRRGDMTFFVSRQSPLPTELHIDTFVGDRALRTMHKDRRAGDGDVGHGA